AWRVLQAVEGGAYADIALERALGRSPLAPADRGLATELAYGCVRQRRLLQAWIDALGRRSAVDQPPKLRSVLELGIYQLLFCRRVPAAAAVHTSVALAQQLELGRLAPVVNGLLRELQRRRAGADADAPWQGLALPSAAAASLGLRHSLPAWLAEALLDWSTPEQAEAFARACNAPAPLDLRVNRLRSTREDLLAELAAAEVVAEPLEGLATGLSLREPPGDPRRLSGYGAGRWCVQDRTAQRIVPLLDPQPGELVLDACAAPGGKSSHCAERMDDTGEVWAVDRSEARLGRLRANAERLGLTCVRPLVADAATLAAERPDWHGRFHRILVDAPCSGLGTLARHADARWRLKPGAIDGLVDLQTRLLLGLAPLLRPGGRLVLALCTIHPRERDEPLAALLAAQPHWRLQQQWCHWPGQAGGGDGFSAAVLEAPQGGGGASIGGGGGGGGGA
ncbi:MAG: 16S rRNA (cytosine(967)-C(5))-methyltransferase RsmB, partial [Cyanobacteriota bacterium]|nr:16S rRNA (cytosine(967)-C(5))-methyltransferase RsmB [Cyanobacteriota bacterium]